MSDLAGHVVVNGYAGMELLVSCMHTCDAVIVPSLRESMPAVFSEAMQMGVPVVGTDAGDLGGTIRKFGAGVAVAPGRPEALAEAMVKVADAGKAAYSLGIEKAGKSFDLGISADVFLDKAFESMRAGFG